MTDVFPTEGIELTHIPVASDVCLTSVPPSPTTATLMVTLFEISRPKGA